MKSTIVMHLAVLVAMVILFVAPAGLAQVDPDPGDTPADESQPMTPCPPSPEVAPEEQPEPDAALPACTPTPSAEVAPMAELLPPAELPTATPTPPPTPTSTPTPEPPTATPTLEAPTLTPTATSASKTVPVGTLSRQLPFANPGDPLQCNVTFDGKLSGCRAQPFPAVFRLDVGEWTTETVDIQVDGRKVATTSNSLWDFVSEPGGMGPGKYAVKITETAGLKRSVTVELVVSRATSPHILVYPRRVVAGATVRVALAGFPANSDIPVGLYRQLDPCKAFANSGDPSQCFDLARDLGTMHTNSDGVASRSVSLAANAVSANVGSAAFLVGAPGLRIRAQNTAEDLRALGLPWFVVDAPR
jgi:hypothetical protein